MMSYKMPAANFLTWGWLLALYGVAIWPVPLFCSEPSVLWFWVLHPVSSVHCCAVLTCILWYFLFTPLNLSWTVPPQGCCMNLCPLLGGLILLYVIILLESYRKHTQTNWANLPEHIQLVSKMSEIRILSSRPQTSLFFPFYPWMGSHLWADE